MFTHPAQRKRIITNYKKQAPQPVNNWRFITEPDEVEYILQEIPPVAMVPMMWIIQKYFPLLVKN